MARCDEGYACEVCGRDVESLTESDLYLRYLLGEVLLEHLHLAPERHIRCNPELAQYIADPEFPPVVMDGFFARDQLDPEYVAAQEERVTRAWRRLQAIPRLGIHLLEYPLMDRGVSESTTRKPST